jgi:carbon storage regulator
MLVLTRRRGETIVIDNMVHVTVLEVNGERVRLGVAAPRDVAVDRQEVHERRLLSPDARSRVDSCSGSVSVH